VKTFLLIIIVAVYTFFFWNLAKAFSFDLGSEESVHFAAHLGSSYATVHGTEVICTKVLSKDKKLTCTIAGIALASIVGVVKEIVIDKGESNSKHAKGYMADGLGIGLATVMIGIDF